ncbi:hypothetical protein [Actinomadura sp. 9N407]|uniref:hypothetical protein n=1 Tax=Actinomadura sp. 9N407 TaxID=3375154 RepID=UPI00378CA518
MAGRGGASTTSPGGSRPGGRAHGRGRRRRRRRTGTYRLTLHHLAGNGGAGAHRSGRRGRLGGPGPASGPRHAVDAASAPVVIRLRRCANAVWLVNGALAVTSLVVAVLPLG